jgi:hypothetical protein
MIRPLLAIGMLLALCSCSTVSEVRTSLDYNGQSLHSMDLTDPHFYMDDDERGSAAAATALPHYTVDPFCASKCRSRGHSAESCNRACGF